MMLEARLHQTMTRRCLDLPQVFDRVGGHVHDHRSVLDVQAEHAHLQDEVRLTQGVSFSLYDKHG